MLMSLQRLDNVWAYIPGLVEKNCYFAKMFLGLVNSFKIPCLVVQVHHPFRSLLKHIHRIFQASSDETM